VSLIESALAKLRRASEAEAQHQGAHVAAAATAVKASAAVAVAPAPEPQAMEPARRITINLQALRESGYLPEEVVERRFADHYRLIKRPLVEKALAGGAGMRLIIVTSALAGDGKTFTSLNLGLSMARERDASVLLVDADTPRGHISEILGLRGAPGLLDAIADASIDVESLVLGTDIHGLRILPVGKFSEGATELLASARMAQIVAALAARNPRRIVLFDSAPLLVSSEARALTRIAAQIVLVARVGKTPYRAVADALAQIDRGKVQGLILNQAPNRSGGRYYYGYFGDGPAASDDPYAP